MGFYKNINAEVPRITDLEERVSHIDKPIFIMGRNLVDKILDEDGEPISGSAGKNNIEILLHEPVLKFNTNIINAKDPCKTCIFYQTSYYLCSMINCGPKWNVQVADKTIYKSTVRS